MCKWRRLLISVGLAAGLCGSPPAAGAKTNRVAKPKPVMAVINARQTRIFKEPVGGAQVIDIAAKGKKVRVLEDTDDGYSQILFKDSFGIVVKGWVESYRLARVRKAPPNAGQARPMEGEIDATEEQTPKRAPRADEWALATPSLFFWNEWAITYQPRRWRPMLAITSKYLGRSYQTRFNSINLGRLSVRTLQNHAHLGFGIWRRFAAYATLPHASIESIAEFTGAEKSTQKRTAMQEPELRLTGLLNERTSRTNLMLGALYSPAGAIKFNTQSQPSNTVRGRSMTGLAASYWDVSKEYAWTVLFELRQFGEAKGVPGEGDVEKGFTDISFGGSYRFDEKIFLTDVIYTLLLSGARTIDDESGETINLKPAPLHRLAAESRYVFSGETAIALSVAVTTGGLMNYSNGLEYNPNVGIHAGLGLHQSF